MLLPSPALPLVMLILAVALGYRSEMLVPVLALFGSPVATSSYTMAAFIQQLSAAYFALGVLVLLFVGIIHSSHRLKSFFFLPVFSLISGILPSMGIRQIRIRSSSF